MIQITSNFKQIPDKQYYVKKGNYYLYAKDKTILQYLSLDVLSLKRFVIKIGNTYHYFSFAEEKPIYSTYADIKGLLLQFPDIVVFDAQQLNPVKVNQKQGILNTRNLAILGLLLVVFAGFVIIKIKKSKEEDELLTQASTPAPVQQPLPPPKPDCLSNREEFLKNFDYGDNVNQMKLVKTVLDKTVEIPINPKKVEPVRQMVIYKPVEDFNFRNGEINLNNYDDCIYFINRNKVPMVITDLNQGYCHIKIDVENCIEE